jgi:hypothetical protein
MRKHHLGSLAASTTASWIIPVVAALAAAGFGAACSNDRKAGSADKTDQAAPQSSSSDVIGETVGDAGSSEPQGDGTASIDPAPTTTGDAATTSGTKKLQPTSANRDAERDASDKPAVDACTLLELIPFNCVLNQNIKCSYGGITGSSGCAEPVARQALYSAACAEGVAVVEDDVVCKVGKPGTGNGACGRLPTDRGLTAEQQLCCINGEWQARLSERFGGPGCRAD